MYISFLHTPSSINIRIQCVNTYVCCVVYIYTYVCILDMLSLNFLCIWVNFTAHAVVDWSTGRRSVYTHNPAKGTFSHYLFSHHNIRSMMRACVCVRVRAAITIGTTVLAVPFPITAGWGVRGGQKPKQKSHSRQRNYKL